MSLLDIRNLVVTFATRGGAFTAVAARTSVAFRRKLGGRSSGATSP